MARPPTDTSPAPRPRPAGPRRGDLTAPEARCLLAFRRAAQRPETANRVLSSGPNACGNRIPQHIHQIRIVFHPFTHRPKQVKTLLRSNPGGKGGPFMNPNETTAVLLDPYPLWL